MHDVASIRKLTGRVFVIGGGEVYRQTIDYADTLYVTEVHANIDGMSPSRPLSRQYGVKHRVKHIQEMIKIGTIMTS